MKEGRQVCSKGGRQADRHACRKESTKAVRRAERYTD